MSPLIPTREVRGVPSPFKRLLLTDFYDGPKSGVAIARDGTLYVFEFLDWDDQQGVRVFRLSAVSYGRATDLQSVLSLGDSDDWTAWVLPPSLPDPAEEMLHRMKSSASPVAVIASSDLLRSVEVWRPLIGRDDAPPSEGWLESLGLPRNR